MLRFIYIGDQITSDSTDFAFYDTVTDRFIEFDGVQVFDDWDEFCQWFVPGKYPQHPLERFEAIRGRVSRSVNEGEI